VCYLSHAYTLEFRHCVRSVTSYPCYVAQTTVQDGLARISASSLCVRLCLIAHIDSFLSHQFAFDDIDMCFINFGADDEVLGGREEEGENLSRPLPRSAWAVPVDIVELVTSLEVHTTQGPRITFLR
jgi:hypothetical protein